MLRCPACKGSTIPVWYCLAPQFLLKPYKCESCGTAVVQDYWWGQAIAGQAPAMATGAAVLVTQPQSVPFIWYTFGLAFVAAVSLWILTARVKEETRPKPEQFEPHSNKLKWRP
jgi:hypothetical protein